jgi:hypothetical protein
VSRRAAAASRESSETGRGPGRSREGKWNWGRLPYFVRNISEGVEHGRFAGFGPFWAGLEVDG